ncbi:LLM class flavin-dependent oxidoreductase [Nocardioides sp. SLBN-35]|uniref:LLM class flavin-dependent oxidoreductase n=1 Tax=Nocardioides sp. SLBN-35 TaxID=2768445 RepID=UPI001151EA94|nr:LLM class flavin-dependent oxidoreductase [Nocardioides sp. SLBN-35]TQK68940.1 5,10-methylenetetrahydromethanopterin reductase [Nocardioides sp. SLBN-35]
MTTGSPGARFSLGIQTDKSTEQYEEIARVAEDLGFDGVSVFADLGFQPPLPSLLAAARVTDRLNLGTACLNSTLLHPVEIAGQIAVLDEASAGRAYWGLTRGAWLGQIGLAAPSSMAAMAEAVEVVRLLLDGDDRGFAGEHFRIEPGFRLRYRLPERPPPLLLGVWGPRGATIAGRYADEVKLGGCANPAMVSLMASWLAPAATAAGRPADAVGVVAGAVTVVDHDRELARRLGRAEVAMYLDVVAGFDRTVAVDPELLDRLRGHLAEGDHDAAGRLIPDDVLDLFSLCGTPGEIAEHAAALVAAGATRVEFGTPHGLTGLGGIRLLGREVLPALRALTAGAAG